MKKIFIVMVLLAFSSGALYAVTTPTEEDYKNLNELRGKLVRMKREMDQFMKELLATSTATGTAITSGFGEEVKVDVSETDKDVIVRADLPGMDKDKIDVVLDKGRILKISGSREFEKRETSSGVVRQERTTGKFERILELPAECKSEGINASYKSGVLEIAIPKKEISKAEEVKIKIQ